MLLILLLLALLSYRNGIRAQQRGLSPTRWTIFTVIAFICGLFVSAFILAVIILSRNPKIVDLATQNNQTAITKYMTDNLGGNAMVYSSLFFAGGIGGYLLIRYLIDKNDLKSNL
jgi:hypothetical protein